MSAKFLKIYIIGLQFLKFGPEKSAARASLEPKIKVLRYTPVRVFRIEQKIWPKTGRSAGLIDPCTGRASCWDLAI